MLYGVRGSVSAAREKHLEKEAKPDRIVRPIIITELSI
jgi:hypothetical protein